MAIDMIEHNELSALAPSRLGLSQFIDEGYSQYTGGEDFFNLFGSRRRKKGNIREQIRQEYASLPTDCANIQASIDKVKADMAQLSKEKNSLDKREGLSEMGFILSSLKSKQLGQGCLSAEAIVETKAAETIIAPKVPSAATTSEAVGVNLSEVASPSEAPSKRNKTWIYVGVGVVALIGIALILKNE